MGSFFSPFLNGAPLNRGAIIIREMKPITKKLTELTPYENNPRNNAASVDAVAKSIKDFGFLVPIVIDKHGVILSGHTRYLAAKKLGRKTVPCIDASKRTEEQANAFRLADNKVGEKSTWDEKKLEQELNKILKLDMSDYGFEISDPLEEDEEETEDWAERTVEALKNIENPEVGEFEGDGDYDIPMVQPTYEMPEVREWIPFNYVLSDNDPEGKGVHFFIHDYQFERVWNNPERYAEKLSQYACVLAPDFSPYLDMPKALRIYNTYRKNWCAAYWQSQGITVIPVVRACKEDADFCFDGIPENAIIAISTMGLMQGDRSLVLDGYEVEMLHPKKILIYSNVDAAAYKDMGCDVEVIPSFSKNRWGD